MKPIDVCYRALTSISSVPLKQKVLRIETRRQDAVLLSDNENDGRRIGHYELRKKIITLHSDMVSYCLYKADIHQRGTTAEVHFHYPFPAAIVKHVRC